MADTKNPFGQPIGTPLPGWVSRPAPPRTALLGRFCRLEPLATATHAARLHAAYSRCADDASWTYLPYGPFSSTEGYTRWVASMESDIELVPFAILSGAGEDPGGVASYLRINRDVGSMEVGHLCYSPSLRRTPASTEAMYLMMRRAFDELGYRRYEWKCDSRNANSRRAAERLGFRYAGTFRQAAVMKGRNRDTAWFSIIDEEWPEVRAALEQWLDPSNFDEAGRQRERLEVLRRQLRDQYQDEAGVRS